MFVWFGSELLLYIVNVSSFPAISWGRLNLYTYNFIIYFTCIVSLYTVTIQDWSLTGLSDVIYIYIYIFIYITVGVPIVEKGRPNMLCLSQTTTLIPSACRGSFFVQWFEGIDISSLCWYWWNYLPSQFKLSFTAFKTTM